MRRSESSELILASASPRRARILAALGVACRIVVPAGDEETDGDPVPATRRNAAAKFGRVRGVAPGARVLAADTVVVHAGRMLGKPRDLDEARDWLLAFAGTRQVVVTSMAWGLDGDDEPTVLTDMAEVVFRGRDAGRISEYLTAVHPLDKAGGYDIADHGGLIIERWIGSWTTIMGLPAEAVARWLGVACPPLGPEGGAL